MPRIPQFSVTPDGDLECPSCSEAVGLHADEVMLVDSSGGAIVLEARDEEGLTGATVYGARAIPQKLRSSRRHSVVVVFRCEICGTWSRLGLIQHKGATQVRWDLKG